MEFNSGSYKNYFWFETHQLSLSELIENFPELFLQKYLVNIYFDGEKLKSGTPQFLDQHALRNISTDNHDQWVLSKEKLEHINFTSFVNFTYFSLIDWDKEIETLEAEDDRKFIKLYSNERKQLKKQFWKEMEEINISNFISDGSKLIFVAKDNNEIEKILKSLSS